MKKRLLVISLFLCVGLFVFSQEEQENSVGKEFAKYFGTVKDSTNHEIKTNFLDFVLRGFSLGYEVDIKDYQSLFVMLRRTNGSGYFGDRRRTELIPEFRLYFLPEANPNRNFAAAYFRYTTTTSVDDYYIYDSNNATGQTITDVESTTNRTAFGINFGRKWSNPTGFTFETMLGIGREIGESTKYNNSSVAAYQNSEGAYRRSTFNAIDGRIGLSIGYRF